MQVLLFLSLLALSLAGYPLDFSVGSPRDAGEPFWLASGSYSVDVSTRSDLNVSFLEIQLAAENRDQECWWSLWFNGDYVTSGVFTSATPSVITILDQSIQAGNADDTLVLSTEGCWVGRYAIPFQIGDNGAVYLAATDPESNQDAWNPQSFYNHPLTNALDRYAAESVSYSAQYSQGTCRFNNQACNAALEAPDASVPYWGSGQTKVLVDWSASAEITDTDDVIVELQAWFQNAFEAEFSTCVVTNDCTLGNSYASQHFVWSLPDLSAANSQPSGFGTGPKRFVGPEPTFKPNNPASLNSSRFFIRSYYAFTPNDAVYAPNVVFAASQSSILPPYVKVWGLGGPYSNNIHQLVDLRGAAGSDCDEFDDYYGFFGTNANFGYPDYSGYGITGSSAAVGAFPHYHYGSTPTNDATQSVLWCGQAAAQHDAVGVAPCPVSSAWTSIGTGSIDSGDIDISAFALTDGGFAQPINYDFGFPFVQTTTCPGLFPALSQLSYFDISIDGTTVTTLSQSHVDRFDTNSIAGFGVEGFHVGANAALLKYTSKDGFSILASPYLALTAFPAPQCNATICQNGGVCSDVDNSPDCSCTDGWAGSDCSQPAVYCPVASDEVCSNGGVCTENTARSLFTDANGGEVWIDLFLCDCNGTSVDTGDFYGQYCETAPPCDAHPCFNGATCTNDAAQAFTCDCSTTLSPNSTLPFTGTLCDVSQTQPCDSNPCENADPTVAGTCTNDVTAPSGFVCTCQNGWTGPTCSIAPTNGCTPGLCEPFGVCAASTNPTSSPQFTQCICLYGYTGAQCDVAPGVCAAVACDNGGVCVGFYTAAEQSASCLCPDPWVGQHCQWNSTAYNSATTQTAGFLVFLAALISVLI